MTVAPASWARSTRSPGWPSANETAAGRASSVASNASSSSCGTTWLTTNGRSVSARTRAIWSTSRSAGANTAPMLPIAPASSTAATSSGDVAGQMAACRIGTSIPSNSQKGVLSMA